MYADLDGQIGSHFLIIALSSLDQTTAPYHIYERVWNLCAVYVTVLANLLASCIKTTCGGTRVANNSSRRAKMENRLKKGVWFSLSFLSQGPTHASEYIKLARLLLLQYLF